MDKSHRPLGGVIFFACDDFVLSEVDKIVEKLAKAPFFRRAIGSTAIELFVTISACT